MVPYSDATRRVLEAALERLSANPAFSPEMFKQLKALVERAAFDDMTQVLLALQEAGSSEVARDE